MLIRRILLATALAACAAAQTRPAFPPRTPADPAVVERGRAAYGVNCNFCHGSDARGGEGGPNLLRSDLVLNDQQGERIAVIIQNGRGEMPKLNLSKEPTSRRSSTVFRLAAMTSRA